MRVRFKIGVTREADIANGMHDWPKLNFSFAQIVWIVFQMELADAILAQPANLFDDVEPGFRRIADIVIDQYIL